MKKKKFCQQNSRMKNLILPAEWQNEIFYFASRTAE
jgi:hypothetical protein